jgi:hypothetical protein
MPSWAVEVDHDLSQRLTEDVAAALVELFDRYHQLRFRRQPVGEERQVDFARLVGFIVGQTLVVDGGWHGSKHPPSEA